MLLLTQLAESQPRALPSTGVSGFFRWGLRRYLEESPQWYNPQMPHQVTVEELVRAAVAGEVPGLGRRMTDEDVKCYVIMGDVVVVANRRESETVGDLRARADRWFDEALKAHQLLQPQ